MVGWGLVYATTETAHSYVIQLIMHHFEFKSTYKITDVCMKMVKKKSTVYNLKGIQLHVKVIVNKA